LTDKKIDFNFNGLERECKRVGGAGYLTAARGSRDSTTGMLSDLKKGS
jgi:hypothetical protein